MSSDLGRSDSGYDFEAPRDGELKVGVERTSKTPSITGAYPSSDREDHEDREKPLEIRLKDTQNNSADDGELLPAHLITTDFDALRFDAAASLQVTKRPLDREHLRNPEPGSHLLISSPYNSPQHLLDLRTLDTQCRLLAQALTFLAPTRPDYATADYLTSLNWPVVLASLRRLSTAAGHTWTRQAFHTVIFRSTLNAGVDPQRLHDLDANSHLEAVASGGLLKYWFGAKDALHRNLATCVWRSREDARLGGLGPDHRKARIAARELYKEIRFSTWELLVEDGAAEVRLEAAGEEHTHGNGRP